MPTVTEVTLNELPPTEWMTMVDNRNEAEELALQRGEPYIWHAPNGLYYVADKGGKNGLT